MPSTIQPHNERIATVWNSGGGDYESLDETKRASLRRDFIAFHDGFHNELGICVPREYLVTVGVRR